MSGSGTTFEIEIRNQPGALSHVVGLFARRACNVERLLCLPEGDGRTSRLWISTKRLERPDRMTKFVANLEDVVSVICFVA